MLYEDIPKGWVSVSQIGVVDENVNGIRHHSTGLVVGLWSIRVSSFNMPSGRDNAKHVAAVAIVLLLVCI